MSRRSKVMGYYSNNARRLILQYEKLSFEDVHPVLFTRRDEIGKMRVLDVGSGPGRDAAFLSRLGSEVVAIEPVDEFREYAKKKYSNLNIRWVKDFSPELISLGNFHEYFDLIVCSAMVMELSKEEVSGLAKSFFRLLKNNGEVYITVKIPNSLDWDIDILVDYFLTEGFFLSGSGESSDLFGRLNVEWRYFFFRKDPSFYWDEAIVSVRSVTPKKAIS